MKRFLLSTALFFTSMTLLTGCLNLQLGGGTTNCPVAPTVGQQLIDLQEAHSKGAISATEYQAQKARLLERK